MMARQRARCRNPECGTYDISNHETQVNDATPAGLLKGFIIARNFVVLCIAGSLGMLAVSSSFFWAACIWVVGGMLLYALAKAGRQLDAATVAQYHYTCALCGKTWGDIQADEDEVDLLSDHESVAV
jgi:hypothetical protein